MLEICFIFRIMQNDPATYRTVIFPVLKPWYRNYLKFSFETENDNPLKVNRSNELGKYLFSMVRSSTLPIKFAGDGDYIKLMLSDHKNDTGKYKFLYYTTEDVKRISDFIESTAYIDLRSMITAGTIDLGMHKKTVIEIFSNIIYGEDLYETIRKDDYRKRQKYLKWLTKSANELGYK